MKILRHRRQQNQRKRTNQHRHGGVVNLDRIEFSCLSRRLENRYGLRSLEHEKGGL